MKKLLIIVSIITALSIAGNVFFISGKGIQVTNNYHQEQYQNQSQAQIAMNWFIYQGEWNVISKNFDKYEDLLNAIKQLNPVEFTLKEIINNNNTWSLIYPEIKVEWKVKATK